MTVSDDTYVADLLRLAGGVNVYARETSRYPISTPEESLTRGADVHFFPSEPFPFKADKHGAEIEKLFGSEKVAYRSWAVGSRPGEIEQELWRQRGIDIFDVRIDDYLKRLSERVEAESP